MRAHLRLLHALVSGVSLDYLKDLLKNLQENFILFLDVFYLFFILGCHDLILISQSSQTRLSSCKELYEPKMGDRSRVQGREEDETFNADRVRHDERLRVEWTGRALGPPVLADDTLSRLTGGIGVIPVSSGVGTGATAEVVNRNIVRGVQPAGRIW
jgi:hypothetical protein